VSTVRTLGCSDGVRCDWLGRIDFARGLALQEAILSAHASCGDTLLLLEHDPVYTTGRGGRSEHLGSLREGEDQPVPLFRIGRGGDVTYHGPGQLMGYAMIDLRVRGGDVHAFLRALESGVIAVLSAYGVTATRLPARTGAWVVDAAESECGRGAGDGAMGATADAARKIASIGIGVRRGISCHGFAINVDLDLAPFAAIVPCGLHGVRMTSIALESGRPAPPIFKVAEAAAALVPRALADCLPLVAREGAA
jgi:lipoate-protein ligase B